MMATMNAVKHGKMDVYGIPKTRLKDRISSRVTHGIKKNPGPRQYLDKNEKRELSTFKKILLPVDRKRQEEKL